MSRTVLPVVMLALLLPFVAVPGAAQEPARQVSETTLVVEDLVGDPLPFGLVEVATPLGGVYSHVDIERFVVQEERPDSFQMVVDLVGRTDPATLVAEAASVRDMTCYATWTYDDMREYEYSLYFYSDDILAPGGAPGTFDGALRRWSYVDGSYDSAYWNPEDGAFTIAYDAAEHAITFTLMKQYVVSYPDDAPPAKGVTLTPLNVRCSTDVALYGQMGDTLDLRGHGFAFSDPGAGSVVTVAFAPDVDRLGVVAGETAVVPLLMENHADTRRIVTVSARALDAASEALPWNLTIAPKVDLRAYESRVVTLLVTAPDDAAQGTSGLVQVDIEVLGADAPGRAAAAATVVPVLGPGMDTFGLFAAHRSTQATVPFLSRPPDITMSLLDAVEGYDREPVEMGPFGSLWGRHALDPLGRAIRLDAEGRATLTLAFQGDVETSVGVDFVFAVGDEVVVAYSGDVPASGATTITLPIRSGSASFPAASNVYFELYLYPQLGPTATTFDPEGSSFRLPLLPVAEREIVVTDGRFVPTLGLAPGEESEAYLNPSKLYTFELVLANEGVDTDDLRVSVAAENATGWRMTAVPGAAFRVPAGNATVFGVEVVPPADAAEGDRLEIIVTAVSKHDAAAKATMRLTAVVTTLAVAEKGYSEREGQLAPLTESKEAPVMSVLPLLLGLGFVLSRRRR